MIFQIVPSQTQGLPLAGNQEGWVGGQNEYGDVPLAGNQEGWVGRQNEFGDVTHAMPVMHGPPSCNDDACKARLSDLQGEKDRLGEKGKELSDEVTGLQNVANNLQGEQDRLAAKDRELSGEVMDLYNAASNLKWKLTKSESTARTLNQALAETQIDLHTAHLKITSLTNENVRLVTEKNSLDYLSTETLKNLNNAYRREKAHKTVIAALKKGILPMENKDEGILTDIEEAPGSNTNMMAGKRPGDIISSPSSVKAAKTAKKTDVRRGLNGVDPSNLAHLSDSDKKELPQCTRSVLKRKSTRVSKSPPNQENKKKALNNRSQKGDSNDEKTGNMPPEHQARSEVPDHNIPDMNISKGVEIGSLGAGGSGTQSGEGGLDLTFR